MADSIKFKLKGQSRLVTFDELLAMPIRQKCGRIRVVDLKSQRNYTTGFLTILRKFK